MVKALGAILKALYSSAVMEFAGAGFVAWAAFLLGGWSACLIVIGVAFLLKSLALDFGKST